jgi:ribosomal protein S18 acetylase RimI-like enzyme
MLIQLKQHLYPNICTQFIDTSHPELCEIIKLSIGNPTKVKIEKVVEGYKTLDHYLIGCLLDNKLIGVIGIQLVGSNINIKHISVHAEYRYKEIARHLVRTVIRNFKVASIVAETDDESIGFYKKLGFVCNSFENSYGRRYQCRLNVEDIL